MCSLLFIFGTPTTLLKLLKEKESLRKLEMQAETLRLCDYFFSYCIMLDCFVIRPREFDLRNAYCNSATFFYYCYILQLLSNFEKP